jgi:hypothetical protein
MGVYVDEETWAEIKKLTFRKHGTLRELSKEVNRVLKENLVSVALKEEVKLIGVELTKVSENQIVRERPTMQRSSLEIIREMRAGA